MPRVTSSPPTAAPSPPCLGPHSWAACAARFTRSSMAPPPPARIGWRCSPPPPSAVQTGCAGCWRVARGLSWSSWSRGVARCFVGRGSPSSSSPSSCTQVPWHSATLWCLAPPRSPPSFDAARCSGDVCLVCVCHCCPAFSPSLAQALPQLKSVSGDQWEAKQGFSFAHLARGAVPRVSGAELAARDAVDALCVRQFLCCVFHIPCVAVSGCRGVVGRCGHTGNVCAGVCARVLSCAGRASRGTGGCTMPTATPCVPAG